MDSKSIKVSVIIRRVNDKQNLCRINNEVESYSVMDDIKKLLSRTTVGHDDVSVNDTVRLLNAVKLSNEIMADAFIDINQETLFNKKVECINNIDDLINQIIKNI